jgi:putative DNA primase/helicase
MINGHDHGVHAEELANALSRESPPEEVRKTLAQLAFSDPLFVERVLAIIKNKTGLPLPALRKSCAQIRREAITQPQRDKPQWISEIRLNREGEPVPDAANIVIPLRAAQEWDGVIAYDEFHQRPMFLRKPPWSNGHWNGPTQFADADEARVLVWVQNAGIHARIDAVRQALAIVADENKYHPVRDYLDGLTWDKKPRLDNWLTYYLGVEPIENYTDAIGPRWLIAGVARIYEPGCLAKYCLVLEGEQDLKKSTALEILGTPWFTDDVSELGTKDASMQVGNAWIVELAELDSVRRAHISAIKAFISRRTDRFRKPFGRYIVEHPRQCILAGTVNPSTEYLTDETGGVRFWPVTCAAIDIEALKRDRDQLWAEARERYQAGEKWWLDIPEMLTAARDQQEARFAADSWENSIANWLSANPLITRVTTDEILKSVFDVQIAEHDRAKQTRVGTILRQRLLWRSRQTRENGRPVRWYERPLP